MSLTIVFSCTFCDLPWLVGPDGGLRWFGPRDCMPVCARCIRDAANGLDPMRHRRVA